MTPSENDRRKAPLAAAQPARDDSQVSLVNALLQPEAYPHPVGQIELIETHISWVFLAGEFCYKVKKPVQFDFLDFGSLELRKFYCEEELRLNRRFAPELYLDVVPITGSAASPHFGGEGPASEYAVRSRRFPPTARMDQVLARGEFSARLCDRLAEAIASAHQLAAVADQDSDFGTATLIHRQWTETLQLAKHGVPHALRGRVDRLQYLSESKWPLLVPLFAKRREQGCIRECHGDLHLENMIAIDDQPRLFDCLEFNPALRWIDVMSDVAFVVMDLDDRGHPELAARLLNRYLELTDDYVGLGVLRHYQMYRAMVRGAVTALQARLPGRSNTEQLDLERRAESYLRLAEHYAQPRCPSLVITHGLSGTGKSTFTQQLLEKIHALRLRSDIERRRTTEGVSAESQRDVRYSVEARRRVYEAMAQKCDSILQTGWSVIIDATFLQRVDRELFQHVAANRRVPLVILTFAVAHRELHSRIELRTREQADESEATHEVLEQQRQAIEPIAEDERSAATVLDASALSVEKIASRIA